MAQSMMGMSNLRLGELIAAVLIFAAGMWLYRVRKPADDSYGSQGAVILFVIAVIMGIHALGGLDYHPSSSELEAMKGQNQ
jgi:hypothetical protein